MNNFEEELINILDKFNANWKVDPLDGDEVDNLVEILRNQLNLINGNTSSQSEINRICYETLCVFDKNFENAEIVVREALESCKLEDIVVEDWGTKKLAYPIGTARERTLHFRRI